MKIESHKIKSRNDVEAVSRQVLKELYDAIDKYENVVVKLIVIRYEKEKV